MLKSLSCSNNNLKLSNIQLINIFFVLGFFFFSYTCNIYILYALLYCIIIYITKPLHKNIIIFLLFLFLSILYNLLSGFNGGYRVFKTLLIFLPVIINSNMKGLKVTSLLHKFMLISAFFIYFDWVLYYTIGFTITRPVFSTGILRLGGLMEDSNFFSYTMLVYIQYLYITTRKYNFFLIGALLLSFSVSAISILIFLMFLNWIKFHNYKLFICFTIVIICCYYMLITFAGELRSISILYKGTIIGNKLISLAIRFEGQADVFNIIDNIKTFFFGIGAGNTKMIIATEANLHNSYLQMFLEMGFLMFIIVFFFICYFLFTINKNFIILFCIIFLLGNILEVVYYPLLSFIYFLSKSYENKPIICT